MTNNLQFFIWGLITGIPAGILMYHYIYLLWLGRVRHWTEIKGER